MYEKRAVVVSFSVYFLPKRMNGRSIGWWLVSNNSKRTDKTIVRVFVHVSIATVCVCICIFVFKTPPPTTTTTVEY